MRSEYYQLYQAEINNRLKRFNRPLTLISIATLLLMIFVTDRLYYPEQFSRYLIARTIPLILCFIVFSCSFIKAINYKTTLKLSASLSFSVIMMMYSIIFLRGVDASFAVIAIIMLSVLFIGLYPISFRISVFIIILIKIIYIFLVAYLRLGFDEFFGMMITHTTFTDIFVLVYRYTDEKKTRREFITRKELENSNNEIFQLNKQLKELDRAKTNFFANVSHELRTPLTLILAPLESVIKGEYPGKTDNKFFRTLYNNAERLFRLINNLLDFSRIEQGRMELRYTRENIPSLIELYISNVRSGAESAGLEIHYRNDMDDKEAVVDRELFDKAVYNLLSNSIKFTPKGGSINISLRNSAGFFEVTVEDTGIGIPEEYHESVFDRFSQVDSGVTRKYEGSGIGLSIVKGIVELHKGSVRLESEEGKGTTITLSFPMMQEINHRTITSGSNYLHKSQWINIAEAKDSYESENSYEPFDHFDESIPLALVVEDNPDMLSFLTEIIGNKYRVLKAENGNDALEIVEERHEIPDIVVSDVMMPGMDGLEFTERLRSIPEFEGVPVILLTARADVASKITGLEKGAVDYITKPFNAGELYARMNAQLEMKVLRDRLRKNNEKLYAELKEFSRKKDDPVSDESERKVRAVIRFIEDNFDSDLSRDELARTVDMSPDHLSRVFNRLTGKKIMDFIYEKRIERAKSLLSGSDRTITFIAHESGFDSIRTFNRVFKKYTNNTPAEYRDRYSRN